MKHMGAVAWCLGALILLLGCSASSGETQPDGDDADGDRELDTPDGEEPDGDVPEDGDETDGDETDGDADGDTEDGDTDADPEEDGPLCDNPDTTWDPDWRAPSGMTDTGFVQYTTRLHMDGSLADGVNALAGPDNQGRIYLATEAGLFRFTLPDQIDELDTWPQVAYRDVWLDSNGSLAAISGNTLYLGMPNVVPSSVVAPEILTFVKVAGNHLVVGTQPGGLGRVNRAVPAFDDWYGPLMIGIQDVCAGAEATEGYIATLSGVWRLNWTTGNATAWDYNASLPDANVTALLCAHDSESDATAPSWIATAGGLARFTGLAVETHAADAGLPYLNLRGLALGQEDAVLIASDKGLMRRSAEGHYDYYHSRYWLPDWDVRDAVELADGRRVVATAGGLAVLTPQPLTFAEKAGIMDDLMATHYNRLGMFSPAALREEGDPDTSFTHDDDNDGQWTGMYLAAQSFRYAVTRSPVALDLARQAKDALLRLIAVTGKPGFFARSVIAPEECESRQCEGCGEWHLSEDNLWCWKGDTSSDEYVGHIFGLSLYFDLVADETEKAEIRDAFVGLHDGIIQNGYILEDIDGRVTTHGQFNPAWMELIGIFGDAGLNGAMILGGLRATYHMSGEARFLDAFYDLALTHGYADYVRRIEQINLKAHTNHDSEEMSFLAMATLVRYETDPCLIPLWQEGLDYLWEVNRPEKNAEFAMLYAWMAHDLDKMDLPVALTTLQQWYLHGIKWTVHNSHRADYTLNPKPDRHGRAQSLEVLPFDQKQVLRWAENPYQLDHDGNGKRMEILTPWLLPYWLGRYLDIIREPVEER